MPLPCGGTALVALHVDLTYRQLRRRCGCSLRRLQKRGLVDEVSAGLHTYCLRERGAEPTVGRLASAQAAGVRVVMVKAGSVNKEQRLKKGCN